MGDNTLTPERKDELDREFDEAWDDAGEDQPESDTVVAADQEGDEPGDSPEDEGHESLDDGEAPQQEAEPEAEAEAEGDEGVGQGDEGEDPDERSAADIQREKSWQGRLNKREADLKRREDALASPQPAAESAEPQEPTPELNQFMTDYPEIAGNVKALIDQAVSSKVTPLQATVDQVVTTNATDAHRSALRTAHKDIDTIVDSGDLDAYIESQPTFIRGAMQRIADQGTTAEVIELMDNYKTAKGLQKTKPDEPSEKTKPKRRGSTPLAVRSRRGAPANTKQISDDDFDAAWDEATSD